MPAPIEVPDTDDLIEAYLNGASLNQLAKERGISRTAITRVIRENHVALRGRSDAEKVKWAGFKHDRAAVVRQCSAAWQATTGRERLLREIEKGAATVYRNQSGIRPRERALVNGLVSVDRRRNPPVHQLNIGRYNVDLAYESPRLAVEVQRGDLRRSSTMRPERLEYILDRGWDVLVCYCPSGNQWTTGDPYEFDFVAVAKKVIAHLQSMRLRKSTASQYRMIGRDGKPCSPRGFDFDYRP